MNQDYRNQYGFPTNPNDPQFTTKDCGKISRSNHPTNQSRSNQLPLDMKNFRAQETGWAQGNGNIRLALTIICVVVAYMIVQP